MDEAALALEMETPVPPKFALQRLLGRSTEPQILFPAIAVLLLAVIWGATLSYIRARGADVERAATTSTREILSTYEAQVVRALGQIDQALDLVEYWLVQGKLQNGLADLQAHELLPPNLLFVVSIADRDGNITQSTSAEPQANIAGQDYFQAQLAAGSNFVGKVPVGSADDTKLVFSRRLESSAGEFLGVATVSVDASYFVSGYEPEKLGEQGVLALVGTDGNVRVRRSGDSIRFGDTLDYAAVLHSGVEDAEDSIGISENEWDHRRRWTAASEIFGFPLATVVGLSVDEQVAAARRSARTYLWLAALASLVTILCMGILGRLNWQLVRSRARESEIRRQHAERIEYLAYHDGLTQLPNRSLFSKLLVQSISETRRYERPLAVAFLDLDMFKRINDTLGHDAGDELLQEVATRLKSCVRDSDTVARLGGDEFVVLLPGLTDESQAAVVAQKILAAIARPFTLQGQEMRVTASIGISVCPQDGIDEQTLKKNADVAMYKAKADGKNNFQFYSHQLSATSLERLSLESNLRRAIEREEFELHYQAKRDIATGRITGMEALLRWEHPDLGTIAPMSFIPVAEETGMIVALGRWVLKAACLQNLAWHKQGLPQLCVAVNLTTRQFFDERMVEDVMTVLATTGMEPWLLELEIPESVLSHKLSNTLQILTRLKAAGVRIAIGDFGVGYSSLSLLQRFPFDTVKIDRSLVRDMTDGLENTALADAIIEMGRSLSVTVVAQGVETSEQAEFLRVHACDELQGFYFRKPLPAEEFAQLLRAQSAVNPASEESQSATARSRQLR